MVPVNLRLRLRRQIRKCVYGLVCFEDCVLRLIAEAQKGQYGLAVYKRCQSFPVGQVGYLLELRAIANRRRICLLHTAPRLVHGCCGVVFCDKGGVGKVLLVISHSSFVNFLGAGDAETLTTSSLPLTRNASLHFWIPVAPTQWIVSVVCMPSAGK